MDVEIRETERRGHAEKLAAEGVEQGWPVIAAAGGDGTIHEVANGILRSGENNTTFAMIPIGTGNDYAMTVGVPTGRIPDAMDLVAAGHTKRFDVGFAVDEFFVNSLGVGFGPVVIEHIVGTKSGSGWMPYLKGIVGAFWGFEPTFLEIVAGEMEIAAPVMLVEVTIGPTVGGGMIINPGADPTDGLADICVIHEIGTMTFLRYLPMALLGRHSKLPRVSMARAATMELRTGGAPIVVHMDGELRTADDGVVGIEIFKQKLVVICGDG